MTRIPTHERDIIEREIYLPMLMKILEWDRLIIENAPFKFNSPYLELVEQALKSVQKDLKVTREHLRKSQTKVSEIKRIVILQCIFLSTMVTKNYIIILIQD
ncbi:hypothetical protein [Peribacillus sp. R9-11]|uniref:hypothetical protein n=1 Tax=Peribacillus sp. R9-11 TaxID=3073271 RepID=UPI002868F622|nr:hypothetical protein [Peribacillus sp. R9-11]WMX56278.1 hypothetical protein RE409_03210 [Peribacillus sp. R9-11]